MRGIPAMDVAEGVGVARQLICRIGVLDIRDHLDHILASRR